MDILHRQLAPLVRAIALAGVPENENERTSDHQGE